MNKIKLLSRLQNFFNADKKQKKKSAKEIGSVIKKLKIKASKINAMMDACQDEDMRKALQLEADIIKAQIEKGLTVLKNL